MAEPLKSERIVLESPTSMRGAFKRVWGLRRRLPSSWHVAVRAPILVVLFTLALVAGFLGLAWTLLVGLFAWPWRLLRRGSRKRKLADQRHRELLEATRAAAGD